MAAHLYSGIKSLHLVLNTPYDLIRTDDVRDDIIGVKVWYSSTTGFNPAAGQGTLAFDGLSLSITIPNLETNTRYYVKYAFISAIDPTTYTISSELTAQVYDENVKVYGYLTNDPTGIATAADGSGGNFSLATGTFKVFNLSEDITGNGPVYSIKANSTYHLLNAIINPSTGIYSCTGMDADSGSVTFLATYNDIIVEQVWNVYKGIAGANAPIVKLTATNSDFIFKDQFATTPVTPETQLTATLTHVTGALEFAAEGFTREGNSLGSVAFTRNNNVITITGSQVGALGVTLGSINVTATVGTVSDTFTLYRINDGTEQITVELSNSAHVIPAANNGDTLPANYVGSGTIIKVKQGNTYLNVDSASPYDSIGTWNIFDITSSNITCDPTPTIGADYINFDTHAAMTDDKAYIDYTIAYRTTTGHVGTQKIRQSFAKSKEGAIGSSASDVVISAPRLAFILPKNTTTVIPSSITLTATTSNISNATFVWSIDGVVQTGQTNSTLVVPSFSNVITKTFKVDVSGKNPANEDISLFDEYTLYYIEEGSDAIAADIENANQTISCDSTGTPISGQFPITKHTIVARGTEVLTTGVSYAKTDEYGMSSSINSSGVITINSISQATASATYSITVGSITLYKTVHLNKSIDGASAPVVTLTTPNQVFITLKNNGGYNMATTTITATVINIPSASYAWYVDGALQTGQTNSTFAVAAFASGSSKVVKCIATHGAVSAYDEMTIFSIQEGSDSYMVGLTNETQTLTADKDGTLYGGQLPLTSQMVVVRGAVVLSSGVTYSKVSETGMTSTINSSTGAISVTAFTATAQATATYRATIGSVVLDKTLTINRTKDGATGTPGTPGAPGDPGTPGLQGLMSKVVYAVVTQSATGISPPATPTGNSPTSPWQTSVPTAGVGQIVYYSYGRYNSNYVAIDGVPAYSTVWSDPIGASVFQDIKSDNWSGGTPSGGAFTSSAGYYLNRSEGSFYGSSVYLRANSSVDINGKLIVRGNNIGSQSVPLFTLNGTAFATVAANFGYVSENLTYSGATNILRAAVVGYGYNADTSTQYNAGVLGYGKGSGSNNGIGVIGYGEVGGGWFETNSTSGYAIWGIASGTGSGAGYFKGQVDITGTGAALNVSGNITATGSIAATGNITSTGNITAYSSSDKTLKTNIVKICDPLAKLNTISGYTYTWIPEYLDKHSHEVNLGLIKPDDYGVLAQEMLETFPEAVHKRPDGTLAVNYEKLIPYLLEAVKELDRRTR